MDAALLEQDPLAWLRTQPVPAQRLQACVLEALARRAAAAEAPLRAELLRRLQERASRTTPAAPRLPSAAPSPSPLSELLAALNPSDASPLELRALSSDRRSWSRLSLERRLMPAPQRADAAEVGPLHADALMPRALTVLGQLSPDYLQRLVTQVDALLALTPIAVPDAEPPRAAGAKRRR